MLFDPFYPFTRSSIYNKSPLSLCCQFFIELVQEMGTVLWLSVLIYPLLSKYFHPLFCRTTRRSRAPKTNKKVSTESMLNFLGLNVAKLFRYYETGKPNRFWVAPDNLEPEVFRKPSWKRLAKKERRLNAKMKESIGK